MLQILHSTIYSLGLLLYFKQFDLNFALALAILFACILNVFGHCCSKGVSPLLDLVKEYL